MVLGLRHLLSCDALQIKLPTEFSKAFNRVDLHRVSLRLSMERLASKMQSVTYASGVGRLALGDVNR